VHYYNEWDAPTAAWLRELIRQGHLPAGDVDERSITEVQPDEIRHYTQWHFFAGIGGWPLALRLAGWPEDRPVLTGSPPCQPFSGAGKQRGVKDERHLAPAWLALVAALRPACVFGEQVAAAVRKDDWLDDLLDALETEGYSTGAIVLPACGVGSPHIRQRLWIAGRLGDAKLSGLERHAGHGDDWRESGRFDQAADRSAAEAGSVDWLANAENNDDGRERRSGAESSARSAQRARTASSGAGCGLADAGHGSSQRGESRAVERGLPSAAGEDAAFWTGSTHSGWNDADWLFCRDGKWRPVEPGTFPLAHGVSARVGRLRGYGNAIVPQVAVEVIRELM